MDCQIVSAIKSRCAVNLILALANFSEISFSKDGVNTQNENDWSNQHKWFKENIEKFDKVFRKRIKKLNAEDWAG